MNVSSLASSCESQVFCKDMTAAGNEAKTSTSSARRLRLFNLIFILFNFIIIII